MALDDKERLRYSRHLLLKEVGEAGQNKLKSAKVAVVGCGGLGSPALLYLAASGIGELTFLDDDEVELSNLQRQIMYKVNHLGQSKAKAAGKVLTSLNNQISLHPVHVRLSAENLDVLLADADFILDCSDNFKTRYLLNTYCLENNKVLISGAAIATQGQVMVFDYRNDSACYACLFPEENGQVAQNCDNFGVLSPLLGVIGSMQALYTVNMILGHHSGSVFKQVDGLTLEQKSFTLFKDPDCLTCSDS